MMTECPDSAALDALLDGTEPDPAVRAHLDECARCREYVARLHGMLKVAGMLSASELPSEPAEPLSAEAAERVRQTVFAAYRRHLGPPEQPHEWAVLLTDMADSVAYALRHDLQAAREKQKKHDDLTVPLIAEHDGELLKKMGDALLAVFDRVIDAARCAVAMQQRLHEYNRSIPPDRADEQINIRAGIHWDSALLYEDDGRRDIKGPAVDLAARVESGGGRVTDQILLSKAALAQLVGHLDELAVVGFGTILAKGVGMLDLFRIAWQEGDAAASTALVLAARTGQELASRMREARDARGIHCLFIDPATGRGHVRPLFVQLDAAECGFTVDAKVEADAVMNAAVERAARTAFEVLHGRGFTNAVADCYCLRWGIEGLPARYEGASIGLGVALATAAAVAGVPVDASVVVTGGADGGLVVPVAGAAVKWQAIRDHDRGDVAEDDPVQVRFKTLVLARESLTDLPPEAHAPGAPLRVVGVETIEEAIVEILGPAMGLATRRLVAMTRPPSIESIRVELWLEHDSATRSLRSISVPPDEDVHTWHVGDAVRICARADRDCHLAILDIGSSGKVVVLAPSRVYPSTWVRAGESLTLPPAGTKGLRLDPPPGIERLIALASDEPLQLTPEHFGQPDTFAAPSVGALSRLPTEWASAIRGRCEIAFYVAEDEPARRSAAVRGTEQRAGPSSPFRSVDLD